MGAWFESVAEAQRRSRRILPPSVYGAIVAGAERGNSASSNVDAFAQVGLLPRLAGHAAHRDASTTIMGIATSAPIVISPTGVQGVHPDGEVAVAQAAASRGIAMGVSAFSSAAIEDVAVVHDALIGQVYWSGTRAQIVQRLDRLWDSGVRSLIVTLDWSFSHGRDAGSPWIPQRLSWPVATRFAPQALSHPRWLARFARARRLPDLTTPNMQLPGAPAPRFFEAYGEWMQTQPPTWEDVAWLCEAWEGPVMLKGVARPEDARRAVDAGAAAISVSNHGGNNLDTTPAAIRLLPAIADAVGHDLEVLLDGGVRQGSDVAKALALGARAVMVGRAPLWGLAANGRIGVENVLDILISGLDATMRGLGRARPAELDRSSVYLPDGFVVAQEPPRALMADAVGVPATAPSAPTWTDVTRPITLVPLGAYEQHGPHLPLDVDTTIALAVVNRLERELSTRSEVLVAPALAFGASDEHTGFPGTVSVGADSLQAVLLALGRSIGAWAARVVFVNAHGGNAPTLARVVPILIEEGIDAAWLPCAPRPGFEIDAHAGRTETSLLLALAPDGVRLDRLEVGITTSIGELLPALRRDGVRSLTSTGVIGDPTVATAAEGRSLLASIVERSLDAVLNWRRREDGMLGP